ncbi:MAG: lipopolysaccharide assembly protein LapB [Coxiella sp. RIFCSPHIGHO2_12_FULL_42_15]|nr:MAG: lipopolysaccharide assembly protein LapB [Coxiella sp. RIFCSPHIGHO2_12_FULL_42_15]
MLQYLFGLLPVAATCGWWVGRRKFNKEASGRISFKMRRDYFKGLNYLINEQPDKAVDVFIKLLEVDSDTVETHLALGSLFRRRGEVERAIRIHQNIIARPNLATQHRLQALSELGQDYLRAGVLDRAERLFLELVELGERNQSSYRFLLSIYQQEKDWLKAIEIAQKLQGLGEPMGVIIAHYHCEIAEHLLEQADTADVHVHLKKAQSYNPSCVRASLIRARIEFNDKNYKAAIQSYQKVINQDPEFLIEAVNPLIHCYRELDAEDKMSVYFQDCLIRYPHLSLVLAISSYLKRSQSDEHAIEFIAEQVQQKPSLPGLKCLVTSYLKKGHTADELNKFAVIDDLLSRLLVDAPNYRCGQCGFSSKSLFWLCPSCHKWETIKPIQSADIQSLRHLHA